MDAIPYIDELINEYMLFRGLMKTFSQFASERAVTTGGGSGTANGGTLNIPADVDALCELILGHVRSSELHEFEEVWATLRSKFFIHLEGGSTTGGGSSPQQQQRDTIEADIRDLEIALKKAMLVKAHTRRRIDKVRECIEKLHGEMVSSSSSAASTAPAASNSTPESVASIGAAQTWDGWFALPYVSDPSSHPLFGPYFHRRWFSSLAASLRNFLVTLFRVLPLPRILAFNIEREKRRKAATELRTMRAELQRTKAELASATSELARMKNQGYRIFQRTAQTTQSQSTPSPQRTNATSVTSDVPHPDANGALDPANAGDSRASVSSVAPPSTSADSPVLDADDVGFAIASSSFLTLDGPNSSDDAIFDITATHVLLGHAGPVSKCRFNTEGTHLATMANNATDDEHGRTNQQAHTSERSQIKLWSMESVLESRDSSSRLVSSSTLSFHNGPDDSFLASPPPLKTMRAAHTSNLRGTGFVASGGAIDPPAHGAGGIASDVDQLTPSRSLSHATPLSAITFSKSDRYLLTGSGTDGRIGVWSLPSAAAPKLMTEFHSSDSAAGPCPVVLDLVSSPGDRFLVAAAAGARHAALDGSTVSHATGHGVLEMYDLGTGKRDHRFIAPSTSASDACTQVNSIALNHNGNMLVSGGADGMVRVWDTRSTQPMLGWIAHDAAAVSCLRLCADETTVMSAGLDGSISEWSLHRTGKAMRVLHMPSHVRPQIGATVAAASARPSSEFLARPEFALDASTKYALLSEGFGWHAGEIAPAQPRSLLYSLADRTDPVQSLQGHAGPVLSVDWHPSADLLATAASDHTARLVSVREKAARRDTA